MYPTNPLPLSLSNLVSVSVEPLPAVSRSTTEKLDARPTLATFEGVLLGATSPPSTSVQTPASVPVAIHFSPILATLLLSAAHLALVRAEPTPTPLARPAGEINARVALPGLEGTLLHTASYMACIGVFAAAVLVLARVMDGFLLRAGGDKVVRAKPGKDGDLEGWDVGWAAWAWGKEGSFALPE